VGLEDKFVGLEMSTSFFRITGKTNESIHISMNIHLKLLY